MREEDLIYIGKMNAEVPKYIMEYYIKAYEAALDVSLEMKERSLDEKMRDEELSEILCETLNNEFGQSLKSKTLNDDYEVYINHEYFNELLEEVINQYRDEVKIENDTGFKDEFMENIIFRFETITTTPFGSLKYFSTGSLFFKVKREEEDNIVKYEIKVYER